MIIKLNKKEQKFIAAYFECVRFTEFTEDSQTDFCEVWEREQIIECLAFFVYAECYLSDESISQAGHDFWLSRNGHGTGFWDRDASYYAIMCETGYRLNQNNLAIQTLSIMKLKPHRGKQ